MSEQFLIGREIPRYQHRARTYTGSVEKTDGSDESDGKCVPFNGPSLRKTALPESYESARPDERSQHLDGSSLIQSVKMNAVYSLLYQFHYLIAGMVESELLLV